MRRRLLLAAREQHGNDVGNGERTACDCDAIGRDYVRESSTSVARARGVLHASLQAFAQWFIDVILVRLEKCNGDAIVQYFDRASPRVAQTRRRDSLGIWQEDDLNALRLEVLSAWELWHVVATHVHDALERSRSFSTRRQVHEIAADFFIIAAAAVNAIA